MAANETRAQAMARKDPRIARRVARMVSTFDLYAADGSYLGSASGFSAQTVADEWERVHGEAAHLIEELD
jgi:hypothetical protein